MSEHEQAVNAWLARVESRSTVELMRACEAGFAALWQRAHLALGEVTLLAIVDRVLHTAKEQSPLLASVEVTASGLRCEGLQTQAGLRHGDVVEAIRFVLTEFLTVVGKLTAEILTPALHTRLSNAHPAGTDRATEDPVP